MPHFAQLLPAEPPPHLPHRRPRRGPPPRPSLPPPGVHFHAHHHHGQHPGRGEEAVQPAGKPRAGDFEHLLRPPRPLGLPQGVPEGGPGDFPEPAQQGHTERRAAAAALAQEAARRVHLHRLSRLKALG